METYINSLIKTAEKNVYDYIDDLWSFEKYRENGFYTVTPFDIIEDIKQALKKRGYDDYGTKYTKEFVVITIESKSPLVVSIRHDIKHSNQKYNIVKSHLTSLLIACKYFERI